jgi:integrase
MINYSRVLKNSTEPGRNPAENLARLRQRAQAFATNSKSENTRKAYRQHWARFEEWCRDHDMIPLPASPITVASFITHLAETGIRPSSIGLVLTSISQAHQLSAHDNPTRSPIVRECQQGIRRQVGTAPAQKAPIVVEHLRRIVNTLDDELVAIRDRALVLVGFAGAFRRSELVALDIRDIEERPEGLKIRIRSSKTDQEGAGRSVGIPFGGDPTLCPIRALRRWLQQSRIETGPIFRAVDCHGRVSQGALTGRSVARIIKRLVQAGGYNPQIFSGHSLRAGLATAAAAAGKSERAIMGTTGHRSERMVRRYVREGSLFRDNAADGLL